MSNQALTAVQQHSPNVAGYLHDAAELRSEIEAAMRHISGNRLLALEESLWRQQVLCTSLKHLSQALSAEVVDAPIQQRLCEAGAALQQLNHSYSLLIQQCAQHNGLLLCLCRSYQETQGSTSPWNADTGASAPSWSCEA